ncbi:MAG: PIN domain-containing protein [Acidobacteriota bacterium]|nr:MAG: PIN domain-containing protein [Acidobacteriota bacterium]
MNVLVDTSVWSLAFRRSNEIEHPAALLLKDLVTDGRAALIGPIRQEILSGVRSQDQFVSLRNGLRAFPDIVLRSDDYEEASRFYNLCRANGIQGSNTDFLICAVASERKMPILTTDKDLYHYARILPISIYEEFDRGMSSANFVQCLDRRPL